MATKKAPANVSAVPAKPAPEALAERPTKATAPVAPTLAGEKAGKEKKERPAPLLAVGDAAPPFQLLDETGNTVRLADFAGKTVILYFYPKDDTPGCTREACAFQEQLSSLAKRKVVVLGVSRDSAAAHVRFKKKYDLTFPLLVDEGAALHRAYGAWGEKTLYGKTREGALRTTVIIDPQGKIHRVFPSVKVDGHLEKVSAALP